jgi:hypothetical protein
VAVGAGGLIFHLNTSGSWVPSTLAGGGTPNLVDVDHGAGSEFWAVGQQGGVPVFLKSSDDGASFAPLATPPGAAVTINALDFIDGRYGFLAGKDGALAKVWLAIEGPSNLSFLDVSPGKNLAAGGVPGELRAVGTRGTTIQGVEAIAVGEDGMAVKWSRPAAEFLGIPVLYDLQPDGSVLGQLTPQWLTAIDFAPSGTEILIGDHGLHGAAFTTDAGYLIRFDGSGWTRVKANTNKSVQGISLFSATQGVVLGRPINDPNLPPESEPGSTNMNDSTLLWYDATP